MAAAQLIKTIQNVLSSITGLERDIDPNDSQDETASNVNGFVMNFDEALDIAKSLENSDLTTIMKEFGDLLKGKNDLFQNLNEIKAAVGIVLEKAQQDPGIKKKLEENLPEQRKGQDITQLFGEYQQYIDKLGQYESQIKLFKNFF